MDIDIMTPVDQVIIDKGRGDCERACIASLLDLPLNAVPNFIEIPEWHRHLVRYHFMNSCGWVHVGTINADLFDPSKYPSMNGYYYASVPSKNFKDTFHAVILSEEGIIAHDPSPHKQYQDVHMRDTEMLTFQCYEPRSADDKEWASWARNKPEE